MKGDSPYQEIKAGEYLADLVDSFWMHQNQNDSPEHMTIVPDGYFKIVFVVQDGHVVQYFMTGLWLRQKQFVTPLELEILAVA